MCSDEEVGHQQQTPRSQSLSIGSHRPTYVDSGRPRGMDSGRPRGMDSGRPRGVDSGRPRGVDSVLCGVSRHSTASSGEGTKSPSARLTKASVHPRDKVRRQDSRHGDNCGSVKRESSTTQIDSSDSSSLFRPKRRKRRLSASLRKRRHSFSGSDKAHTILPFEGYAYTPQRSKSWTMYSSTESLSEYWDDSCLPGVHLDRGHDAANMDASSIDSYFGANCDVTDLALGDDMLTDPELDTDTTAECLSTDDDMVTYHLERESSTWKEFLDLNDLTHILIPRGHLRTGRLLMKGDARNMHILTTNAHHRCSSVPVPLWCNLQDAQLYSRWLRGGIPASKRICEVCKLEIEDKFHFICKCQLFFFSLETFYIKKLSKVVLMKLLNA